MNLPDTNVKQVIINKLQTNDLMEDNDIKVMVKDRKIMLGGTVGTFDQKVKASRYAMMYGNNYTVFNDIKLRKSQVNDTEIARDVAEKINSHVFYDMFDWVTVKSIDGMVYLEGWVNETWYRDQFAQEAQEVAGVKGVIDNIEILPNSDFDDELRHQAARLIYNDPKLENYSYDPQTPVHILVNNGTITLRGFVEDQSDKQWITNKPMVNTNAMEIENKLMVEGDRQATLTNEEE